MPITPAHAHPHAHAQRVRVWFSSLPPPRGGDVRGSIKTSVLLSLDLLPQLFSSLGLFEHAAAGVCSTWSRACSRQLRRCRYINPTRVRQLDDVPHNLNGLCMLPGGVLAVASCEPYSQSAVKFVAARNDSDPQALAACQSSTLAARRFEWLMGLALTNDGLLACSLRPCAAPQPCTSLLWTSRWMSWPRCCA